MAICLNCGKDVEGCLCDECRQSIDIESLCEKIRNYSPKVIDNPDLNSIWEQVASQMEQADNFKNVAFAMADYLPSPRKEYQKILSIVRNYKRVPKSSKLWFCEMYEQIIGMNGLGNKEKLRLKGLMLEVLYQNYEYSKADELASELLDSSNLPWQAIYVIAEFFSQTRRYDEADDAISLGYSLDDVNDSVLRQFEEVASKNKNRREAAINGKKEYLPNPNENKAEAIEKYTKFMASLGIEVNTSLGEKKSIYPTPISKNDYPEPVEKRDADFNSFVAFDFETTGRFTGTDAIIEVGAVRVINGKIVESEEFVFQEFVKPFQKKLSTEITELTGITEENVKDARVMWEVIPDFMKFVGDDILVGYNSIKFDAKFLCRAGRYSNEIYRNKHFDVLRYIKSLKDKIGYTGTEFKLSTVGKFLEIENPNAHRALADAITTAKIYLKLKELSGCEGEEINMDSVLDLEDW